MNIQDALKETGKAYDGGDDYVKEENLILYWYNQRTNERYGPVGYRAITNESKWLPYHEEKEIRPENAGEIWKLAGFRYAIGETEDGSLYKVQLEGRNSKQIQIESLSFAVMVHKEGGWQRIEPPVETEEVLEQYFVETGGEHRGPYSFFTNYLNDSVKVTITKESK